MATTATVIEDSPQADGRRWVVIEFDTQTGFTWTSRVRLDAGVDAQVYADSQIPGEEATYTQQERLQAFGVAASGGDPDGGPYYFNTLAEIQKYIFRALFNLMADEFEENKADVCVGFAGEPTGYLNKYNSATISGFIDFPGWNTPTVNGAAGRVSAVAVNYNQLDHGEGPLPLDDF